MVREIKLKIIGDFSDVNKQFETIKANGKLVESNLEDISRVISRGNKQQLSFISKKAAGEIQGAKDRIEKLKETLNSDTELKLGALDTYRELSKVESELEKLSSLTNKIGLHSLKHQLKGSIQKDFAKLGKVIGGIGEKIKATGKKIAMWTVRSAFLSVLASVRNSFKEAGEESEIASKKFNTISSVMVTALVPVAEKFAKILQTLFVYAARFIYALTGVNIIQKAMDKTAKKISGIGKASKKAGKDVKKGLLSSLDEVTNIGQDSSGGGASAGGGIDTDGLADMKTLQDMMKSFDELEGDIFDKLANGMKFILDNWEIFVSGLLAIKIGMGLVAIKSTLAAAGITLTLGSILLMIAVLVLLGVGIYLLIEHWDTIWKKVKEVAANMVEVVKNMGSAIMSVFKKIWEVIKSLFSGLANWFGDIISDIVGSFKSLPGEIRNIMQKAKDGIYNIFSGIGNWFGEKITDIVNAFKSLPGKVSSVLRKLWSSIKSIFGNIGSAIGDSISGAVKSAIKSVLKTGVSIINKFIKAINGAIGFINIIPGVNISKLKKMEVPSFDVGTASVPKDMLAQIHKGERIVPAKYNHDDYGGSDMRETNEILLEIVDAVRSQDLVIGEDSVGRSAVNYINSQKRIMGRSVI